MFYKLSIMTSLEAIESSMSRPFQYPHLYKPRPVISGLNESPLPIITSAESSAINFGIWGLLPEDYLDEWAKFQAVNNTLNINWQDFRNHETPDFFNDKLSRCLICVTGIFTNKIENGELSTVHAHLEDHQPFAMAGVYTELNDGFYTCAPLIIRKSDSDFINIPNLTGLRPLVLNKKYYDTWLDSTISLSEIDPIIERQQFNKFSCHPVEKEYYSDISVYSKIAKSSKLKVV